MTDKMTEKRFERIYGDVEIVCIDHEKDEFIEDLDYERFIDLLNEQHETIQQLKTQIKIFEEFLKENNLDIYWEYFCTVDECPVTDENYISCKECKYLRWLD